MNLFTTAFVFFISVCLSPVFSSPNYVIGEAQEGDGILSLLKRFQVDDYKCNIEEFQKLNELNSTDGLVKGKSYLLPIQTHTFNSKSIRTTLGISDYQLALSIQHYNERMLKNGVRDKDFREDKILWVPHHFFNCNEKKEETTTDELSSNTPMAEGSYEVASKGVYKIFGSKYEKVPKLSERLKGQVFYIVSGHGGPDPGAVYTKNKEHLCEDEYAYDVALRLTRNLISHGATAYVIVRDNNDGIRDESFLKKDTDEVVWGNKAIPLNQKKRLKQRSDIINNLYEKNKKAGVKEQSVVFIHVDSRKSKKQIDLFFYYRENDNNSKKLADKLHKTVSDKYKKYRANGRYTGTVSYRDLYVLRETELPAVFIELGNITNVLDQQRIFPSKNRQALANWFCEGLMK
jgi:N-acetylmuramoyl-L-alanine amidase